MRRYWRWWWKRLGVIGTLVCFLSAGSTVLVGYWLCDFTVSQGQVVDLWRMDDELRMANERLQHRLATIECLLHPIPGQPCED